MNNINSYIQEKLKVGSKSKVSINYDPDKLIDQNILLFDTSDDDFDQWDFDNTIEDINNEYDHFIVTRFNSLSNIKNFDHDLYDYSLDLDNIIKKIMTGRDLGYEIKVINGHLEVHCINSGSRATYYIYAIDPKINDKLELWFDTPEDLDGDTDYSKLEFLFKEGNIIPIEL